jgi:hypothetical protein
VRPTTAPYTGMGRRPRPRYYDKPSSLASLALQAGQEACVELIWRRGSKGLQRGRFLVLGSARRGDPAPPGTSRRPRVLVPQRPSSVAILHPSHTAIGRPIGQASGWVPRRVVVEATLGAA